MLTLRRAGGLEITYKIYLSFSFIHIFRAFVCERGIYYCIIVTSNETVISHAIDTKLKKDWNKKVTT